MPAKELLSSLLRPRKGGATERADSYLFDSNPSQSPSPGPTNRDYRDQRHATADFTEADDDDDQDDDEDRDHVDQGRRFSFLRPSRFRRDENGDAGPSGLLPLFSASHLDSLPIYNIVHAIRIIVQTRTETTLSWDQLRSPQVSQFLVKPMQQQIRTQHFNRATLYALMANCLQFTKEGQLYPGNAGVSSTRAKVCELLGLKLLKEYSTRELIDTLSYDFYPLQGLPDTPNPNSRSSDGRAGPSAARSSTLEVAIRASAKHFLAHPLVVQQLEAIWNGAISFYSSQDSLHREPSMLSNISKAVFWFWSAGFMLDEVVGFSEQGFSLYIMSFWNIFDLGILLLLIVYYCMRVYGVFLIEPQHWNDMAYDVLAANAILLLPRIFSVLDHYQYFSQLLIGFRLMAMDLVAVFVLVLVSCSGFFVFFTLSKNQNDAPEVAYKIFQILMGFTPAAWDVWPQYNVLGRILLIIFLIICHFLVVTILITVLTNSFMAIASNAREEHQFLFAINTISMVKNDALFSYIAPGNIFAWILMPFRYVLPIRQFVLLNRTVIKVTHFPILFTIFLYEKYFLATSMYEPTDLVDNHGHSRPRGISFADPANRGSIFSPNVRAREESIAGMQKDQALEEVFRRPPDASTMRNHRRQERKNTLSAIRNWMDQNDDDSGAPLSRWPTLGTLDGHVSSSQRRMSMGREFPRRFRQVSDVRSAASDPADLISNSGFPGANLYDRPSPIEEQQQQYRDQTDADGDDELMTNDDEEEEANTTTSCQGSKSRGHAEEDYFTTPHASRRGTLIPSSLSSSSSHKVAPLSPRTAATPRRNVLHSRTLSTNTILFAPQESNRHGPSPSSISEEPLGFRHQPRTSRVATTMEKSDLAGARSPRKTQYVAIPTRPRPIPSKSAPNSGVLIPTPATRPARRPSSVEIDIMSDTGLGAIHEFGAVPSSFATQMAMATGQLKGPGRGSQDREATERLSRLMLAKMKTLEEGFADVVKEMRVMRSGVTSLQHSDDEMGSSRRASIQRSRKSDSKNSSLSSSVKTGGVASTSNRKTVKGKGKATDIPVSQTESEVGERRTQQAVESGLENAATPQSSTVQAPGFLNLPPAEAARRRETAVSLLTSKGVDPATLSAEQFYIFANQTPQAQEVSLEMLAKYGAAKLRIVHPEDNDQAGSASSTPAQAESATPTPAVGSRRQGSSS
ncbi:hypothetical protein DL764_003301 [Monosporascus ibericus]|uniref:Ion transport domain-containing protein n=1 Tax=Monosporascus ibericus TaxID=155417 RepID=A0A4V1XBG9_9PEZI|nr:hypothetical protein DL764_003301 [Monosporascus ibericus]